MNTQNFLTEGGELYPKALMTIDAFAASVQLKLEPVVSKHTAEQLRALGLRDYGKRSPWCVNDRAKRVDRSFAYIGFRTSSHELYWCVAWSGVELSSPLIDVRVGFELPSNKKDKIGSIHTALRSRTTLEVGQRSVTDIHVKQRIESSQMDSIDQILERLLVQWISLWNDLGGIAGVPDVPPLP